MTESTSVNEPGAESAGAYIGAAAVAASAGIAAGTADFGGNHTPTPSSAAAVPAAVPSAPVAPIVVALDGPAGSGKSSVSKAAARVLGYGYLDTGAAYRALAWHLLDQGLDLEGHPETVAGHCENFPFTIGTDPDDYFVRVGESDVTEAIREPRVTNAVRHIAKLPPVRQQLNDLFRQLIATTQNPGIVVEGRDITTVVAPDAPVRILLTASEEARMARRSKELTDQSAAVVGEQLRSRDQADSRVVDFMNAADGVITVDSTEIDFAQTVSAVVEVVHTQTARISHGR